MAVTDRIKVSSTRRPEWSIALTVLETDKPTRSPPPTLIMGHGIGAIRAAGLPAFAQAFNKAGYHAVTFDYLHWGDSDGLPRNHLTVSGELQDFRDIIAWARSQPQRFDVDRIVAWGTSFGGMHITALLAEDHELAAGIAQCPCVDGFAAAMKTPLGRPMRLLSASLSDAVGAVLGYEPTYVGLSSSGRPGSPLATMVGDAVMEGWDRITPTDGTYFPNKITARSLVEFSTSRPILKAHKIVKPYLIVLPTWDDQAPLEAAEKVVRLTPLGESLRVSGGHFELYAGGPSCEKNIAGQLAFLRRVLS